MNWERLALGVTLVALAATWVWRPPIRPASAAAPHASLAPPREAAQVVVSAPAEAACRAGLDVCHEKAWSLVLGAMQNDVRERKRAADGDAGAVGRGSSAADQQRELDDIAREHLRKGWKDKQAELLGVVRDVGTEPWVREEIPKILARFDAFPGIDDATKRALRDGYADVWAKDGASMHDAIASSPPDLTGLLDEVKAFYQDEDALVLRVLGEAGLARYRSDQRRSRTAILAIIASLADEDWDDAIAW